MSDTLDDLLPDAPEADHPKAAGLDDLLPEHEEATPENTPLPHPLGMRDNPVDKLELQGSPRQIARASMAPEPAVQLKRYAKQFGQPETDFKLHNDKVIRRVPETGTWAYVEPERVSQGGMGERLARAGRWAASGAGSAIPRAAGALGAAGAAILATPETLGAGAIPAGMAGGAASQAGGELLRQKIDQGLAKDDTATDLGNVGWHALEGATIVPGGEALGAVGRGIARSGPAQALGRLAERIPGLGPILAKARGAGAQAGTGGQGAIPAPPDENPLNLPPESLEAIRRHLAGKWGEIEETMRDAKDAGLNLTLGQVTRSPTIQKAERIAAGWPEGAEDFGVARRAQNEEQVPGAVGKMLDEVSPWRPDERGAGVEAFREGADAAKRNEANELNKNARTAFKGALDDKDATGKRFWSEDLEGLIKSRPSLQKAMGYAKALAAEKGDTSVLNIPEYENGKLVGAATVPTWRGYEWIRKAMRAQLDSPENTNPLTGKPNAMGNMIQHTYDDFMGHLLKANPEWGDALVKYGTDAHDMNLLLRGGLKKLADLDQPDRLNMVRSVFAGGQANPLPQDIRQIRQAFQKADKLPEWDAGVRGYLQDVLDNALKRTNTGDTGNVAGKMLGAYNTENQREVLAAALGDPGKAAKLDKMMRLMKHAASMLPEGSPTQTNKEFAKGTTRKVLGKIGTALHLTSPSGIAGEGMKVLEARMAAIEEPAARRKVVEFLMNPAGAKALDRLLVNSPSPHLARIPPPARDRLVGQLNNFLAAAGIAAATPGADDHND